ncbi:MAG TPA: site-2 protease family protein [Gemmataceae bacterium]|jgi:Zn-dependent protease
MRDPLTWSFPLGRMFGIRVNVHVLFPVIVLALILRVWAQKDTTVTLAEAGVMAGLLFVSVLLHEFGHCFAARSVDGDATEVLLWPLGGLAYCDVPHTPRAHLITALGGPAVDLILCVLSAGALLFAGLVPPLNPLDGGNAYQPKMYDWHAGAYRTGGVSSLRANPEPPKADAAAKKDAPPPKSEPPGGPTATATAAPQTGSGLLLWQVLAGQLFWLNWFLFLLNMVLVGFPLDGGRVLQAILWSRSDYRQATSTACYAGFMVFIAVGFYAIWGNEVIALALSLFVYLNCKQQLILLETGGEDAPFGYDFSQGYTSLEGHQAPATTPRRKRPNWFQRWMQQRAARKARREQEQREAEERRMDELLAKVQQEGIQSLTDEERRFLTRVSARYRGGKP